MIEFIEKIFSPLTNLVGSGLEFFYSLGSPWWLSIVILTVIVRAALFPLTIKQVRSMRAMQDLKPEMDKIRSKYKDNRQKQQEEMMKLYQERQVNPLGGCLPLLVQMPVFITMFYVIRDFGQTHESFSEGGILWFTNLSAADPYYILPVLSAVTMLASMEITSKNIDPQQRWLMRILPVAFTLFLLQFASGLFIYWIASNIVTLIQNYLIYYRMPGRKDSEAYETNGGSEQSELPNQESLGTRSARDDDVRDAEDPTASSSKGASRRRRKKRKK